MWWHCIAGDGSSSAELARSIFFSATQGSPVPGQFTPFPTWERYFFSFLLPPDTLSKKFSGKSAAWPGFHWKKGGGGWFRTKPRREIEFVWTHAHCNHVKTMLKLCDVRTAGDESDARTCPFWAAQLIIKSVALFETFLTVCSLKVDGNTFSFGLSPFFVLLLFLLFFSSCLLCIWFWFDLISLKRGSSNSLLKLIGGFSSKVRETVTTTAATTKNKEWKMKIKIKIDEKESRSSNINNN